MPRWCTLHVHLRGRLGALLFAAARLPGHAARRVHGRRYPPRILERKTVRALLHGELRALRFIFRLLPRPADAEVWHARPTGAAPGQDSVGEIECASAHFAKSSPKFLASKRPIIERTEVSG